MSLVGARSSSGRSTCRSTYWANCARWSVKTSGAVSAMKPAVSLDQYSFQPYWEMRIRRPGFACSKASAHFW
jgi:hypothetical protein